MTTPIRSLTLLTRLRASRLAAATMLLAPMSVSCYTYLPQSSTAGPGADVRVTLTDAGSLAIAPLVGPRIASLDGRVDRVDSDSLVLRVRKSTTMAGAENGWAGERLSIPATAVSNVFQKRLSTTRTAIAAAVGVGLLAAAFIAGNSSNGGDPLPPGGPVPGGQ